MGHCGMKREVTYEVINCNIMIEAIRVFGVIHLHSFHWTTQYMQFHWITSSGFPMGVGHGVLSNIRYLTHTYCGGARAQQGQQLLTIWSQFHDNYGVFCIDVTNIVPYLMLQQTGLLKMYKSSSVPACPVTVILTVLIQSDLREWLLIHTWKYTSLLSDTSKVVSPAFSLH